VTSGAIKLEAICQVAGMVTRIAAGKSGRPTGQSSRHAWFQYACSGVTSAVRTLSSCAYTL
jgi:hypothetical protein